MNRLVGEVDRANEGIQTVSVQVARLETRIDGMEKRLELNAITSRQVAFSSPPQGRIDDSSKDALR